jgi:hypothetical protein
MINVYSTQQIDGVVYEDTINIETNQDQWWFIYDAYTKRIVVEPLQCSGTTSSPYTMVVTDTEDEINQYIVDNGLV